MYIKYVNTGDSSLTAERSFFIIDRGQHSTRIKYSTDRFSELETFVDL